MNRTKFKPALTLKLSTPTPIPPNDNNDDILNNIPTQLSGFPLPPPPSESSYITTISTSEPLIPRSMPKIKPKIPINLDNIYETSNENIGSGTFKTAYKAKKKGESDFNYVLFRFIMQGTKSRRKSIQDGDNPDALMQKEIYNFNKFVGQCNNQSNNYVICPVATGLSTDPETNELVPAIVTNFVKGIDFDKFLQTNILKLSNCDIIKIMINLTNSIQFIHDNWNFVHFDLKPDNIIIDPDTFQTVIIDLGSGCIKNLDCDPNLIKTTEQYGAPEIKIMFNTDLQNFELLKKADVYSLGKIFRKIPNINNQDILDLINNMTQENELSRPTSKQILNILNNALYTNQCGNLFTQVGGSFFKNK
jgi:serine/threonine protein kinase